VRNSCTILVVKSVEKGLQWRSRHRWEVNNQQSATETRESMDWV